MLERLTATYDADHPMPATSAAVVAREVAQARVRDLYEATEGCGVPSRVVVRLRPDRGGPVYRVSFGVVDDYDGPRARFKATRRVGYQEAPDRVRLLLEDG